MSNRMNAPVDGSGKAAAPLRIVFLGLSISSSWGNGHATTYRALARQLSLRGHEVTFLERDVPWYASNRDLPNAPFVRIILYKDIDELKSHEAIVKDADFVIVGSYVPQGIEVGQWVLAIRGGRSGFYDIDTPVTISHIQQGCCEYLSPELICRYDLYLSFSGGPVLKMLMQRYGSRMAVPLFCAADETIYFPQDGQKVWMLGYLGTYSDDRQSALQSLLLNVAKAQPSRRFVVAGPQYPSSIRWPVNVERIEHLPPEQHREFYNSQSATLNVTRAEMIRLGYSPSVRIFEAAACGTPIISDYWPGLEEIFEIGSEVLVAADARQVLGYFTDFAADGLRMIGENARRRVLASHTAAHRAAELEKYIQKALDASAGKR